MKEKPILFSGPMVRAILSGNKTQTRRIVKPQPVELSDPENIWKRGYEQTGCPLAAPTEKCQTRSAIFCPYGYPAHEHSPEADRLWVRESFATESRPTGPLVTDESHHVTYMADHRGDPRGLGWKPSIFMPRAFSRITLEVTGIRVERLQDISEEDAIAEGLSGITKDGKLIKYGIPDQDGLPGTDNTGWPWRDWQKDPRDAYRRLWESINGRGSWDANPWVWVVEFKRVEGDATP